MRLSAAFALFIAGAFIAGCDRPGPAAPSAPATFAGSAACATCHAAEHAAWSGSQHRLAMQEATAGAVLGRFDDRNVTVDGVAARFFRRDGRYFVNTAGPGGETGDFELRYTFGVWPLQQYLVPLDGGRLQAFGLAWDARPAAAGGQRWFSLYPGQTLRPGDPLHWTGIDQTWNYQCADCHSTDLRKNYDAAARRYDTTWSEISVGCEACHGPASRHLQWAAKKSGDAAKGLVVALDERRGVQWVAKPAGTASRSAPRATSREIETCARCHARRGQFDDAVHAGDDWLDAFRPALLEPGLYHADGRQREEVYTWGSFLQSRMHAAGVTCSDCHEPHSGKLRAAGNAVCAQCHAPAKFDTAVHHHHEAGLPGSRCVDCHMPTTTYMVVDPRHDHSLRLPGPGACETCHAGRGAELARWYPQPKAPFQSFAAAFAAADAGDASALAGLRAIAADAAQPAIVRASAIHRASLLAGAQATELAAGAAGDPSPLVRAAAAEALADGEPGLRAERLAPLLTDPVRLVRMAAARALAGAPEQRFLGNERADFDRALAEWTAAQRFNGDRPEAWLNLGSLQATRGDPAGAIASFGEALALDASFVEASVNLADVQRAAGDEAAAERTLRDALARNPQSAGPHHALGLSLVRQRRLPEALAELAKADELAPGEPRYAYVHAVALHDTGDVAAAIATLKRALARHPNDRELAGALAAYEAER